MQYNKLLQTIKKHTWWEEKSPAVYQYVMYPLHCFVEQCRYFHPKFLSISAFVSTPGDFFHELTPQDEKSAVYWYVYGQITKNPSYLIRKKKTGDKNKVFLNISRQFRRDASRLSNKQVWRSYERFIRHYLDFTRYVVMPECVDVFTAYELEALVRKELPDVSEDRLLEVTRMMATPAHLSFMEAEHSRIMKVAIALYSRLKKDPRIGLESITGHWKKELEKLSRDYYWISNSYATVIRLCPDDFLTKVKGEVKEKSIVQLQHELRGLRTKVSRLQAEHRRSMKAYKFSAGLIRHFRLVQFFGEWIDERKSYMLRGNDCLDQYCRELARRFRLPVHDVRYYLPAEMKNLLLKGERLDKKIIKARQALSAYVIEKRGHTAIPTIYYGQQAKKVMITVQSQFQVKKGLVIGQVASVPVKKFTGIVQVIKDVHKEKFISGRILVASMTRPDFVPLMRRARAIITDEGGLTCHAAIMARELNLPCIIGTKNATVEFKTGTKVEMDLAKGIIIKK
ncbi:MAG: PEP-utilizing enzyme [Patescibacteria group bacterium]